MSGVTIGQDAAGSVIVSGDGNIITISASEKNQESPQKSTPDSPKVDLSSLPTTSPDLFGRSSEVDMLNRCWDSPKTSIVVLVAWGGVGKTSLVNHWLASMAQNDFQGADRVFGWSFYSQGAAEGKQASADRFIADALRWFGDPNPNQGDFADKAKRLSALIKRQKTLLILDGLEPLQAPPGPEEGRLKDQSLRILLRDLAVGQKGLCVITTRLWTDDLSTWRGKGVERIDLSHLASADGAALLRHLGVQGAEKELRQASQEFDGHALALTLLGTYLAAAYNGDVRQRDKIDCLMYEDMPQGKHARCVMESYEAWMQASDKGRRELNILRMMGLFDRPAEIGAIRALRAEPAIPGLTDPSPDPSPKRRGESAGFSEVQWQFAVKQLRDLRLLSEKDKDRPDSLDCHPLIREHFGEKLRSENPAAWKEAHSRLYEYYKNLPEKEFPDTLEEMEPLFAAVAHGCRAGRYQEALDDVFWERILRKGDHFSTTKLGAYGAVLSAVSNFFEILWKKAIDDLSDDWKAKVYNWAGFCVRPLGRLHESIKPMELALEIRIKQEKWDKASMNAGNLSEIWLMKGDIKQAISYAQRSVSYADLSSDRFLKYALRTTFADALHQANEISEAERLFEEAEVIHKEETSEYPYLSSIRGFRYRDLLMSQKKYGKVIEQASKTLDWAIQKKLLLAIALDRLSLGCAFLLQKQENYDFMQAEI